MLANMKRKSDLLLRTILRFLQECVHMVRQSGRGKWHRWCCVYCIRTLMEDNRARLAQQVLWPLSLPPIRKKWISFIAGTNGCDVARLLEWRQLCQLLSFSLTHTHLLLFFMLTCEHPTMKWRQTENFLILSICRWYCAHCYVPLNMASHWEP